MKKILFIAFAACMMVQQSTAQVTGITVETHYTDNGTVAGYPAGHKTYRIYANLTHTTDRLTSVFGDNNSPLLIKVSESGIWNHADGGVTAYDNSCAAQEATPALAYDSFLAIGYACNDGSAMVYAMDDPNTATWIDEAFDAVPYGINDIAVNTQVGALWYGMHADVNTQAGEELRVLVAQITTDGAICGTFNFQVFPEYTGIGSQYIEQTGFSFNLMEATLESEFITCYGFDDGKIMVNVTGGVAPYEYNIGEGYVSENPITGVSFGNYTVLVRDASGCIYTVPEMAMIAEPEQLQIQGLQSMPISENVPGGNTPYTVSGGVFPYTFQWTDEEGNVVSNSENLPQLFGQVAAGTYTLTVTDEVGCTLQQQINVSYTVNVDEIDLGFSVDVFPNPVSGVLTLRLLSSESKNISYSIMDTSGRNILSSKPRSAGNEFNEQIDMSSFAAGIYFLEVQAGNASKTVRVVKM